MNWVALMFAVLAVLLANLATRMWLYGRSVTGVLRVDHSDPEKVLYRFEIDDLDELDTVNRVILKIDHNADLSQK